MGQAIEFEVADFVGRFLAAPPAAAPRQNLDARKQFGERIRLREIVVTAGTQSLHAVVDLPERGENQHRRLDAVGPQRRDDRKAVELGQHAIDDHHVIGAVERASARPSSPSGAQSAT